MVASINRYLGLPDASVATDVAELVGDGLTVSESRPMGTVHLLDGLCRALGMDRALGTVLGPRRFTTDVERVLFALVANRAMDLIVEADAQAGVQEAVFFAVADLLNLQVDLLLLDTTSTVTSWHQHARCGRWR